MLKRTIWSFIGLVLAAVACGLAVGVGGALAAVAILLLTLAAFTMLRGGVRALVLVYIATRPMVDTVIRVDVAGFSPGQLWAGGLLALTVACALSLDGHRARDWWPVSLVVVAYLGLAVLRGDALVGLGRGVRILSWALLVPVIATALRQGLDRRWVLRSGYAFALLAALAAGYSVLTGRYGESYYALGSSLTTEYQAPHALVTMLVLGSPFVAHALLTSRSGVRWAHSGVLAALVGLTILSMVRSGILAMGLLLFVLVLQVARRGSARQRVGVAVAGSSVLGVWLWLQDVAITRLSTLLPGAAAGGALGSGRSVFWLALLREVMASPTVALFGMGGGADRMIISAATGMRIGAHSDPLELLAVGGLVLLSAYAAFLYSPVRNALKCARDGSRGAVGDIGVVFISAFAGFLVLAVANGVMGYQGSVAFGLLGALAMSLPYDGAELQAGIMDDA